MALTQTELLDAIVSAKGTYFNDFENRLSEYGAFKAFTDNSAKLLPKSLIENMRQSEVHKTQIPVLDKYAATLLTTRACSVAANDNLSKLQQIAWVTRGFKVSVIPAKNAGNYISVEDDFAQQFAMGLKKVFGQLDTDSINCLETNKNTALVTSKLASQSGSAYVVSYKDYNDRKLFAHMPALMKLNDLNGKLNCICNSEEESYLMQLSTFGANNFQNSQSLVSKFNFYHSNRLSPGANRAVHYMSPEGSIGVYNWLDWEARQNAKINDGDKKYVMQDPIFGISWAVHEKTACVDDANYKSVYQTIYEFTSDFSFISAYASDGAGPVVKLVVEEELL